MRTQAARSRSVSVRSDRTESGTPFVRTVYFELTDFLEFLVSLTAGVAENLKRGGCRPSRRSQSHGQAGPVPSACRCRVSFTSRNVP